MTRLLLRQLPAHVSGIAIVYLLAVAPAFALGQSASPNAQSVPAPASAQAAPPATPPAAPPELPDGPDANSQVRSPVNPSGPTALIDTSMGRLSCKFFDKQAPVTVANFVGLATGSKDWVDPTTLKKVHGQPFYDSTTFHRVIPGFMIQGGDRAGDGTGDPGYFFQDELDPALTFDVPGRLAMANAGPTTNGSQFFITEVPVPQLDGKHTIFGQCDAHSVDLVRAIARVDRNESDKPLTAVVIRKVTIVPDGKPIPPDPMPTSPPSTAPTTP